MHSTTIAALFFAVTAIARPLDTNTIETDVDNILADLPVPVSVTLPNLPVVKRQIDLSGVTGLVGGLVGDVTGVLSSLLPTVTTTLNNLGSIVDGLVADVTSADLDSELASVETTLEGLISEVNSATSAAGADLSSALATVQTDVTAAVTEAESLLSSVQSLAGLVSVTGTLTEVESLTSELVGLLAGLL